jgi:hypothetical protein
VSRILFSLTRIVRIMKSKLLLLTLVAFAALSCTRSPTRPPEFGGGANHTRVLFVGNSLTWVRGIPDTVQRLADVTGRPMVHLDYSRTGWSLQTHLFAGITDEIKRLKPDIVILQQGPSDDTDTRNQLITDAQAIAAAATEVGARTALFMVWPPKSQQQAFPAVRASYRDAAIAAGAEFIPAGSAWLEVWARDPTLEMYNPDEQHPSHLGALVASHTIFAVIFNADPHVTPALPGGPSADVQATVRAAVAAALANAN